jgi:protein-S-isoprenylcysteine O-methyltransferase Ste14
MMIGAALVVLGLAIRAVASGHVQKNEQLATTGPYAYTRNPLYLGSLILAVGFAISARNWLIGAGLILFFLAIYLPVIHGEEVFLGEHFPQFAEYARRVPRLLPRLTFLGPILEASRIQCDSRCNGGNSCTDGEAALDAIAES